MNAKMAFPSPLFPPPTSTHNTTPHKSPSLFLAPCRRRPLVVLRATGPATANDDNKEEEEQQQQQQPPPPPPITVNDTTTKTPRTTLSIKYRVRSKNQARQRKASAAAAAAAPSPPPKKEWDAMTLGEKAVELYVGEKGLLFWLNKLAYASIFVVIGGWILFRFVGPSLGLYQLDSSPLPPTSIFKGSP